MHRDQAPTHPKYKASGNNIPAMLSIIVLRDLHVACHCLKSDSRLKHICRFHAPTTTTTAATSQPCFDELSKFADYPIEISKLRRSCAKRSLTKLSTVTPAGVSVWHKRVTQQLKPACKPGPAQVERDPTCNDGHSRRAQQCPKPAGENEHNSTTADRLQQNLEAATKKTFCTESKNVKRNL
eukprot:2335668-Amphidinium_carterae.1